MPSPASNRIKSDYAIPSVGSWSMQQVVQRFRAAGRLIGATGGDGIRYRAFISYSHRDEKVARWLHRKIETYRVPRELIGVETVNGPVPRHLGPVFRDEDELPGAAELGAELTAALDSSAALIVICSPAAAQSAWVDREIRVFKERHPSRPVLALISEGAPGTDRECFPQALRLAAAPDGGLIHDAGFEPLAPDLQKQDGQVVRLKLIAGLLGVRYADLYRRDRRRAQRLAAGLGSAGLLIMAALSILSAIAFTSARTAVRERNSARRAEAIAEQNADLAERRAWLAQTAAQEVRRENGLLARKQACR